MPPSRLCNGTYLTSREEYINLDFEEVGYPSEMESVFCSFLRCFAWLPTASREASSRWHRNNHRQIGTYQVSLVECGLGFRMSATRRGNLQIGSQTALKRMANRKVRSRISWLKLKGTEFHKLLLRLSSGLQGRLAVIHFSVREPLETANANAFMVGPYMRNERTSELGFLLGRDSAD